MPTPDDLQFKELVLANSLATPDQVEDCVEALTTYEQAGIIKPLSAVMLDKGYLTTRQVNAVRQLQGKDEEYAIRGYTILSTLGQGGLGTVYKARQDSMGRTVALKIMFPNLVSNKEYVQRFMREAKISAELDHPNIVRGIDFGESEGFFFFAMEYVDGSSLKDIIKETIFNQQDAVQVIAKVADALKYAEHRNLIHRDIKPENIMLTKEGEPKLCDLGLAKIMESTDMSLTRTGIVMGTPHYLSPEQAVGQKDLDIRSDIYSLGITLYHMITGDVPYQGTTVVSIISQHLSAKIPSPREKNPEISEELCTIISTMMAKKREDRYQTAQELLVDLKRFLRNEQPIGAQKNRDNSGIANYLVNDIGGLLAQADQEEARPSTTKLSQEIDKKKMAAASQSGKMIDFIDAATIDIEEQISTDAEVDSAVPSQFANGRRQALEQSLQNNHTEPVESHRLVQHLEQRVQETATRRKHSGLRVVSHLLLICLFGAIATGGYLNKDKILAYFVPARPKPDLPLSIGIDVYQEGDYARTSKTKYLEASQQLRVPVRKSAEVQKNMVHIAGGSYWHTDETGQRHRVTVASFWLDQYEVNNGQYYQFCRQTGREFPLQEYREKMPPPEVAALPVVNVSYYDACLCATWLGKRLPSEQEWEYAVASSKRSSYPWGNHYQKDRANIDSEKIAPVHSYPAGKTASDIYNLAGNVWEWTSTPYGEFKENYIIKGGSFAYSAEYARSSYRDGVFPHGHREDIGFRCALGEPPAPQPDKKDKNEQKQRQPK